MKKTYLLLPFFFFLFCNAFSQNVLMIPPSMTGTNFTLDVQAGTQTFFGTTITPTYGINGPWMAPTIIVNKGDSITLNVVNNLNQATTMHWHGLHVSAMNDGGPHQSILAGSTWSPSFKVRNDAATFWYHPHGAGKTDLHVSKGLAGFFIVKDSAEALLNLPRTYGVDDIPLVIQSKAFDVLTQIAIATEADTSLFVNGTLDPYFNAPAQVLRFRLLNGSSLRTYNLGLSNGQVFYQIATDGGLRDSALQLSRVQIAPGERAEILVDFSGMSGQNVFLTSFNSELPDGIYGALNVGSGNDTIHDYSENFLNGADFNLLEFNIGAMTGSPVTTIPSSLVPYVPYSIGSATVNRIIRMDTIRLLPNETPNLAEGPFGINDRTFDMDSINEVVYLNDTEIWTIINNTLVAHPFHIHDIQFNIIEKSGVSPSPSERGWKDVVLVMPGDSAKFITQFKTFADAFTPYMYHCHLLHHEDDGMMGSFIVVDTSLGIIQHREGLDFVLFPNPGSDVLQIQSQDESSIEEISAYDILGKSVIYKKVPNLKSYSLNVQELNTGVYFIYIKTKKEMQVKKWIKIR